MVIQRELQELPPTHDSRFFSTLKGFILLKFGDKTEETALIHYIGIVSTQKSYTNHLFTTGIFERTK